MRAARYAHIGGAILTDHGPIGLGQARDLAAFYRREASFSAASNAPMAAQTCMARAVALGVAAHAAAAWRRAAGWGDPEQADRLPDL
ncbi:MAG TPA: hypothetical protein VII73_00885 [Caulobacteraceae bacterium]